MILNLAIFTATVAAAKAKAAGNASLLRTIEHAVNEIEKAKYWAFDGTTLNLISTTSGQRFIIAADHTCYAYSKTCNHLVARRLMVRYFENLAAADTQRAKLIADVEKAWHRARPFAAISWPLYQIFGVTRLDALTADQLQQIYDAITRHSAPIQQARS